MASSFGFLTIRNDEQPKSVDFAHSFVRHLEATGCKAPVAQIGVDSTSDSFAEAVAALATCDAVIVDYPFCGQSGAAEAILATLRRLNQPVIVRLSGIARVPSRGQRDMFHELCRAVDAVVVASGAARRRLVAACGMAPDTVVLIPDTVQPLTRVAAGSAGVGAPTVITSGILGPDRGLETVIDAVAGLRLLNPRPQYVIAGPTAPSALACDGEAHRHALMARTIDRGVAPMVNFINAPLASHIGLPGVSRIDVVVVADVVAEQLNSPVVVDALATGTPVVALVTAATRTTALAAGIDRLVPAGHPQALAEVLRLLLTDPAVVASVAQRASSALEPMWVRIGAEYEALAEELIAARASTARRRAAPGPAGVTLSD